MHNLDVSECYLLLHIYHHQVHFNVIVLNMHSDIPLFVITRISAKIHLFLTDEN